MNNKFETHFNPDTMSIHDLKGVFREYESIIRSLYNSEGNEDAKLSIEASMKYINSVYKTYKGKIIKRRFTQGE